MSSQYLFDLCGKFTRLSPRMLCFDFLALWKDLANLAYTVIFITTEAGLV